METSRIQIEACRVVLFYDGPLLPTKEGASQRLLMTARSLAQRGYPTTVLLAYRGWSDWRLLAREPFHTILIHPQDYYVPSPFLAQLLHQLAPSWLQTKDPEVLAAFFQTDELLPPRTRLLFECHDVHPTPSLAERWALEVADQVVCLSEADGQDAKTFMADQTKVAVVPCFLPETMIISRVHQDPGSRVAFLGNFYYEPNAEAIGWIIEHLLPPLLLHYPRMQLHIFGDAPLALQQRYQGDAIRWYGPLPHLHPALATCDIALSVVFHGTGFRVKVLDYSAAGLPVVANQLGVGGIGNHACFCLAETVEGLVEHCLALLRSAALRQQHADQAQQLIQQEFSDAVAGDAYDQFLLSPSPNDARAACHQRSATFFRSQGCQDDRQFIAQWAQRQPAWLREFIEKQRFASLEERLVPPGRAFHLHRQQDRDLLERANHLFQTKRGNP
jgi:glycosyltransferase involved in cell wall biosynthesis